MKVFNLRRAMRAALLLLLMSAGVTKVFADETFTVGYYKYYILSEADRTVSIGYDVYNNTFPNNFMAELPRTVTYQNVTYTVTRISNAGFWYCPQLLAIKIPNTVTGIGEFAFRGCANLQTVIIPNSVEDIEQYTFADCPALQTANWPENSDCWKIIRGTFEGCTGLLHYTIPENVTSIDMEAFKDCTSLEEIVFPASMNAIATKAFENCSSLRKVYSYRMDAPPAIFEETFKGAFAVGAKIYVPYEALDKYQTNYWSLGYNYAWPANSNEITADMIEVMPAEKFVSYTYDESNCVFILSGCRPGIYGELVIPDQMKRGNDYFPVTAIDNGNPNHGTFELSGLTKVTFPASLQRIEQGAFMQCYNLTEVDFSACTALTDISGSAFKHSGLTSVSLPSSLTILNNSVFEDCSNLTSVEIPDGLTQIGHNVFHNTNLTSLTLPASVRSIGNKAFYPCNNLTEITTYRTTPPALNIGAFPNLPSITVNVLGGAMAAYQNDTEGYGWGTYSNFTFAEIPVGTLLLYSYDDVNHTATLTGHTQEVTGDIEIPAMVEHDNVNYTVTAIGDNALRNSHNMTSVSFPSTITSIGEGAFFNCTALTSIDLSGCTSLTTLNKSTFFQCTSLESVTLPSGLTSIGQSAFANCPMTQIELPSGLTTIGVSAFASSGLTSILLPASVTSIGNWAFDSCADLEDVYVLNTTPATIGAHTFRWIDPHYRVHIPTSAYNAYNTADYWKDLQLAYSALVFDLDDVNETATLINCGANFIGDLVIPASYNTYPVTKIKYEAIYDRPFVTTISIPETVTEIEEAAIYNCKSLQNITVAAGNTAYKTDAAGALLTIDGKQLLAYPCGRSNDHYDIPNGVEQTGGVFVGNKSLRSINIPTSLHFSGNTSLYYSALDAFDGLDGLTTLTVSANHEYNSTNNGVLLDKNGTKVIYCPRGKAGSYTIPNTVTTIDRAAFKGCKNLTSISIPNNVSTIEDSAFKDCESLTSVVIPEGIVTNGNKTIQGEVFRNCTSLKSVTIPEGITTIGYGAFGNTGLLSLTLPSSVTDISQGFYDCVDLGEITCYAVNPPATDPQYVFDNVPEDIPVNVPASSVNAYRNANGWSRFTNIQAITTPSFYLVYSYDDNNMTATVIYDNSYADLTGDLVIPGTVQHDNKTYTVTAIGNSAFESCVGLTSAVIPHTMVTIGNNAFGECTGLTALTIGRNVKTIGSEAFYNCYNLTEVHYYPLNCESVADDAWSVYVDMISVANKILDIKNCVQTIPDCCFYGLWGLRNATVTIPNSVTSIGNWAFRYSDMQGVNIGSGVTTIGKYAFDGTGLTSVVLPSNVTSVGNRAFYNCSSLGSATVWGVENIPLGMFEGCTALTSFDVKSPVRTIGDKAFKGCTNLATLTTAGYGGNLTTIGEEAFRDCGLTSVDIPNTVTGVEAEAFYGNTNLTTVTIGTGMQYMGSNLFYNCTSLATVNYNATYCHTIVNSFSCNTGNTQKTLHIGNNVSYIPGNAFAGMKLAAVTIPNGVTVIGEYAFYDCANLTEINIPNSVTTIGEAAFAGNQLETITLGSGLTSIGEYAFGTDESQQYLQTVNSYNVTPPSIYGNTFNTGDYEYATLYVLGDAAVTTYQTAPVWGNFFNIQSLDGYYFTGATNSNWGTASNWSNGTVPTTEQSEPNVIILTDVTVDITDAFADFLTIMDGAVVTISSGKKLQIGDAGYGSFTSSGASALVVEDGGSLINNLNEYIPATVEKNITGHNGNAGKWYFISSPIVGANTYEENYNLYYYTAPNSVENLFANPTNNYDLYAFDQSAAEAEWVNYKQHPEDFKLVDGNGYLYANRDNTILSFVGDVRPSNSEYPMTPVRKQDTQIVYNYPDNPDEGYYEQTVDYPFTGWNLVGNPFTCKAYIKDDYSILSGGFYKMNADGTGITSVEGFSEEIPSGTGVFVKVSDMYDPMGGNQYAFTTETPRGGSKKGSLQIVLKQTLMRGEAVQVDNAIVSFNEGSRLEKMVLFRDDAHIAIPQNGKEYAIVCTEPCGEMPLNLNAVMGGRFTLEVAPKDVEMSYLHLIDNLTGTDVDLLKESSYSFESNISDYASRFKLVFVAGSVANEMENFAFFSNGNLVIANDGQAMLQVIDINGRVLRSERINGSANVSLNESAGVYMLRLVNGENVKTQKIIIK